MTWSFFPATWPERDAVTGYQLTDAGRFEPAPAALCVVPAAGGLWTTAAERVVAPRHPVSQCPCS